MRNPFSPHSRIVGYPDWWPFGIDAEFRNGISGNSTIAFEMRKPDFQRTPTATDSTIPLSQRCETVPHTKDLGVHPRFAKESSQCACKRRRGFV
jgi:hypothetical protein